MRCEEHKTIQNRSLDLKSWSLILVIDQRLRGNRLIDLVQLESFGDGIFGYFRPGCSHRMITVRWEAQTCYQVRTWWQKVMGNDGQDRFQSWCDVMIHNPWTPSSKAPYFCLYISGFSITFSYSCSFRSNLGWLASHCRLKTQVLELQTFMSFRNCHLLLRWEFARTNMCNWILILFSNISGLHLIGVSCFLLLLIGTFCTKKTE